MPVINGVYTKDFPALGRAPIDTDIIPIAEVANQITYKTTIGAIFNAKVFGTAGRLSKFTTANTLGNSILNEIGNAIHLTNAGSSFASFGIINPGTPGDPGVDNDGYIGSTINNDFTIRVNNVEAARFDTAYRFKITTIQNATTDTDKFLVSDGGIVKYRTGTELRSDIGAGVGSVTSVALTMPVAFSVANSPITSSGSLDVTAVGTASQYIRGDGQLATLPTGGGGGSAVNYYLNGSIAASVATYKQMSNSAVIGGGTDFNLVGNGLISQFLTDVGNPNRLLIPGGAWNFEMFFSVSSAGGNQKFYIELLKYNGSTFTSIASGSANPEEITGGTTTDLYLTSLAVPETVLLTTDRLAVRVYIVDNSGGRTVTLHTEDNNLCLVTTTFAGGISAINGLTANTQYFAVGTSGTDFNISSLTDTHTFNLPTASATNRGALSSANWTTFNSKQNAITLTTTGTSGAATFIGSTLNIPNYGSALGGYVPYTGATSNLNLGNFALNAQYVIATVVAGSSQDGVQGYANNGSGIRGVAINGNGVKGESASGVGGNFVSNCSSPLGTLEVMNTGTGFLANFFSSGSVLRASISNTGNITGNSFIKTGGTSAQILAADGSVITAGTNITISGGVISSSGGGTVTSVSALTLGTSGTDLSSTVANGNTTPVITLNVPNASATARGVISTGTQTIAGAKTFNTNMLVEFGANTASALQVTSTNTGGRGLAVLATSTVEPFVVTQLGTGKLAVFNSSAGEKFTINNDGNLSNGTYTYTLPSATGTLALTSQLHNAVTLSTIGSTPNANGATLTGQVLNLQPASASFGGVVTTGTQTFAGGKTFSSSVNVGGTSANTDFRIYRTVDATAFFHISAPGGSPSRSIMGIGSTNVMSLMANGNVCIGAITPLRTLTVQSQDDGNLQLRLQGTSSTTSYAEIGRESLLTGDFRINLSRNGTVITPLKINDVTGAATFSSSVTAGATINLPNAFFLTGRNNANTSNIGLIGRNTSDRVIIDADGYGTNIGGGGTVLINPTGGNVGIGNLAIAGYKLDVSGTGRFVSNLTLDSDLTYSSNAGFGIVSQNGTRLVTIQNGAFGVTGAATFDSSVAATKGDFGAAYSSTNILQALSSSATDANLLQVAMVGVSNGFVLKRESSVFKMEWPGTVTFSDLAGTGSRAVLADANGLLSAPVSDISVKENIQSIGYGLNEIVKMNPVWFDFIDDYKNFGEGRQNGNIAQEMKAIIPEAVFITPSTGKMGINYDQLHAVYIKAIQELKAEIDILKNK